MIANSALDLPIAQKYRFLEDEPDWGQDVLLTLNFFTLIFGARNSAEQRARKRFLARFDLGYTLTGLDIGDYSTRRADSMRELGGPIVVPLWPLETTLTTFVDASTITIPSVRGFKVNSFAYFTQDGLPSAFCRIVSVGDNIGLDLTQSFPIALPAYTAGALVYPCVIGMHGQNSAAFIHHSINNSDQTVSVSEL
jgi:hypothetical protein